MFGQISLKFHQISQTSEQFYELTSAISNYVLTIYTYLDQTAHVQSVRVCTVFFCRLVLIATRMMESKQKHAVISQVTLFFEI